MWASKTHTVNFKYIFHQYRIQNVCLNFLDCSACLSDFLDSFLKFCSTKQKFVLLVFNRISMKVNTF